MIQVPGLGVSFEGFHCSPLMKISSAVASHLEMDVSQFFPYRIRNKDPKPHEALNMDHNKTLNLFVRI